MTKQQVLVIMIKAALWTLGQLLVVIANNL